MVLYGFLAFGCICTILSGILLCLYADTIKHYGLYPLSYLLVAAGIVSGAAVMRLMGVI